MLYTTLNSYDSHLRLSGGTCSWIVNDQHLERISLAASSRKAVNIRSSSREGIDLFFEWSREQAAFRCTAGGRPAGIITMDEIKGAIGKKIPHQAVPVQVCLIGDVDVYRKGVLDPLSGMVSVYTATLNLATNGATAYLLNGRSEGGEGRLVFGLSKGDPSIHALHVPSDTLSLLQARLAKNGCALVDTDSRSNSERELTRSGDVNSTQALRQILQVLQNNTSQAPPSKGFTPRR
ncbi:hypothetical protein [Pseudomonas sp. NPDC096950]|uniref:hypothetical protein n=1 Tax=Pseudomonas sp. NPDC096950 TaxID=3364485 RepID=UPI00383A9C8E